ncbi:hypothetical protein WK77_14135 [Burkholderia ubonensis]|nr:hypothetical protein WK76_10265 [Burkholderia ubonensis]KVV08720.1 hypothetical protein WK77_14135 [Burkholderia ubonensis]
MVTALCAALRESCFAGVFFDAAFFTGAFLTDAFFEAWTGVFVAGFLVGTFFAVIAFLTATFLLAALVLVVVGFAAEVSLSAPSIKNFDGSFAPASHAGARPRPLQVAPDFGSRYFGRCGPRT